MVKGYTPTQDATGHLEKKVEYDPPSETQGHKFSGANQKPERRRPFGTGLVRHCPQGLFSPFFTFLCAIYFSTRLDFSSSPLSAPGSPKMTMIVRVNVVLNRTVVVTSDWRLNNLCGSSLRGQSEFYHVSWWHLNLAKIQLWLWRWPRTVSQRQQQSYWGLHSPRQSRSTYS